MNKSPKKDETNDKNSASKKKSEKLIKIKWLRY